MSVLQRSKSGCWTCRLRRKKCFEGGFPCANCQEKGIFCHGYGPKPPWKDRGQNERQEAHRLGIEFRRRRSRNHDGGSKQPSSFETGSAASTSATATSELHSAELVQSARAELSPDMMQSSAFHFTFAQAMSRSQSLDDALCYDFSFLPEVESMPPMSQSSTDQTWSDATFTDAIGFADLSGAASLDTGDCLVDLCSHKGQISLISEASERDMDFIMRFIDEDIAFQRSQLGRRGWPLFVLLRSSTFYYASLSISACHASLKLPNGSEASLEAWTHSQEYRLKAKRFFSVIGETQQAVFGERIICGVQMARLEALCNNLQDCYHYLDSTIELFTERENVQVKEYIDILLSGANDQGHDPTLRESSLDQSSSSHLLSAHSPTSLEVKALSYCYAQLIFNYTFSCSAQRRSPHAMDLHRKLLSASEFRVIFQEATGFESCAHLSAMDVTVLGTWKREQETRSNLSVRELVHRASELEMRVESDLRRLNQHLPTPVSPSPGNEQPISALGPRDDIVPDPDLVRSYVLLHAVLIELHVVVSGLSPDVPEIKKSVNRAIAAWRLSTSFEVNADSLAWSYCTSASVATGEQRDFFREMVIEQGTLRDFSTIVERCWHAQDKGAAKILEQCDWKELLHRSKLGIIFL